MSELSQTRKPLGRKPLPESVRRVRIGCRIDPKTAKVLKDLNALSVGRAIDAAVARVIELEYQLAHK